MQPCARYLTVAVLLPVGILLSFLSTTGGLSLEDRVHQLTENYIANVLAAKETQFEALKLKVQQQELKLIRLEFLEDKIQEQEFEMTRLKATVKQQESLLVAMQNERKINPEFIPSRLAFKEQSAIGKSMFPRTCREVRAVDPSLSSGMHWIDPDGPGVGDDPIYVYCDMIKGSTSVLHDSELPMDVGHCADPGCYSRPINYNATMRQMNALADLSYECHQPIQYDCNYAPFQLNEITYSWWNDRNGTTQTFWSGSNASVHTCQCGIDHNCAEASMTCNCDSTVPIPLTDSGIITDKNYLPITRLSFGRTQLESSSGVHTLGRFECSGQNAVSGMPSSCADLWRIGHTLSGLYSVMGSTRVESVYCDFTKLPADSGFQTRIGYVDVKSSPVYFYVQRNSNFGTQNVPVPFELERLNVGGGMNLASGIFTAPRPGTYFFSLSGISASGGNGNNLYIGLYVNGSRIGSGRSENPVDTYSLQSTIHLNAGDKVSLQKFNGNGVFHENGDHYTHFTGWLLQEDLSS